MIIFLRLKSLLSIHSLGRAVPERSDLSHRAKVSANRSGRGAAPEAVRLFQPMIDKIAALRRTTLFRGLGDAELQALAARAVEQRLARGEVLFVAGDEAKGLYVIVEGALRAFRESLEGREQVIHVERAGATIAEIPIFDEGPTLPPSRPKKKPRSSSSTSAT